MFSIVIHDSLVDVIGVKLAHPNEAHLYSGQYYLLHRYL